MNVEYTKQWVRITDTLRAMVVLGVSIIIALVVFLPLAVFTGMDTLGILATASGAFAVSALTGLVIVRTRKALAINLGERKVRFHVHTYDFSDIETVSSANQNVVLQASDGQLLKMPVFWVSKDNLRVIDRMLRMLDNEKVRTGALTIIQEQVEEMSR